MRNALTVPRKGAAIAAVVTVAAALTAGTSPTAAADYCWLNADSGQVSCYVTNGERQAAIDAASGVASDAAKNVSPAAPSRPMTAARGMGENEAGPQQVIASIYEDVGYGGASFRITAAGGCSGAGTFVNLTGFGWEDTVSSFKGRHGCSVKLFDNEDSSGDSYGYWRQSPYVGRLNDRASSMSIVG